MTFELSPEMKNRLLRLAQENGQSVELFLSSLLDSSHITQHVDEVLEHITDAFFSLDVDWRFIYLNHEAENLLKRTRDELLGKNIWEEFPEAITSLFYSQYHMAVQTQMSVVFIEWYEPLETWFEVNAYPSDKGLVVYFRDVTLRKNLEIALQNSLFELDMRVKERTIALQITNEALQKEILARKKAEDDLRHALSLERELGQLKSHFIAMVSHEFRTPLAAIRTSTDLLKNYHDRMNDVQRIRHLEKIQGQIAHLTTLMETTLLVGRSQAKGLQLHFEEIDVHDFLQKLIQEMQSIAGEKHLIRLKLQGEYSYYHLDKHLTYILLTNLITNAIKYSPKGGDVWVRVTCLKNVVQMAIQDRGIGIPQDEIEKLFEEFYRAKNVGAIGGTGLGLTLVKNIVDLYGGVINITSTVNVGTTIFVHLPACSGEHDMMTTNGVEQ